MTTTFRRAPYLQTFRYYASALGVPQTIRLLASRAFGTPTLRLRLPQAPDGLLCRMRAADRRVLGQVFVERECDMDVPWAPRLIIDGGANVGYSSVFFASKYPGAKLLAIEPDAGNAEMARRNCVHYPQVEVLQAAIWTSDSPVAIANPEASSWEFRVEERGGSEAATVPGITIGTLLEGSGEQWVDILKLDIEGAEIALFNARDLGWLDRVRSMVIECHGDEAESLVREKMVERGFALSKRGEKLCFIRTDSTAW